MFFVWFFLGCEVKIELKTCLPKPLPSPPWTGDLASAGGGLEQPVTCADLWLGICLSGMRYTRSSVAELGHIAGDVQRSSVGLGKN